MKAYKFIIYLILFVNLSLAQEVVDKGIGEDQSILNSVDFDAIAKNEGWDMKGVVRIPTGRAMLFKKDNKILGYCVIEREWREVDTTKKSFSGTTKIVFGDPSFPPNGSFVFSITDPDEIALWVKIYQNHTRALRRNLRFCSMDGEKHFKNKVIDSGIVVSLSSNGGLHFINGDEDTIIFLAATDQLDRGEFNKNPILMSLVSAKIQALKDK